MLDTRRGSLSREHPLFILAMDHRDSLVSKVYDISGEPSADDVRRLERGKEQVFEAAAAARDRLPAEGRPGILVDERYGERVARTAKQSGFTLLMPIERSGQQFFTLEYGTFDSDEWLDHLGRFDPDYAKVLVHDSFSFPEWDRREQQDHLAVVTDRLRRAGIPLVIELLVPDDPDDPHPDFDSAVRPGVTVDLIRDFHRHGVEPDVWKLEGYESSADAAAVAAAAREDGRDAVSCIILGRDADEARLDHWLDIAAPTEGFTGFAIGRSIWQQPLVDHLAGTADDSAMSRRIGDAFVHYANRYARAAGLAEGAR